MGDGNRLETLPCRILKAAAKVAAKDKRYYALNTVRVCPAGEGKTRIEATDGRALLRLTLDGNGLPDTRIHRDMIATLPTAGEVVIAEGGPSRVMLKAGDARKGSVPLPWEWGNAGDDHWPATDEVIPVEGNADNVTAGVSAEVMGILMDAFRTLTPRHLGIRMDLGHGMGPLTLNGAVTVDGVSVEAVGVLMPATLE